MSARQIGIFLWDRALEKSEKVVSGCSRSGPIPFNLRCNSDSCCIKMSVPNLRTSSNQTVRPPWVVNWKCACLVLASLQPPLMPRVFQILQPPSSRIWMALPFTFTATTLWGRDSTNPAIPLGGVFSHFPPSTWASVMISPSSLSWRLSDILLTSGPSGTRYSVY